MTSLPSCCCAWYVYRYSCMLLGDNDPSDPPPPPPPPTHTLFHVIHYARNSINIYYAPLHLLSGITTSTLNVNDITVSTLNDISGLGLMLNDVCDTLLMMLIVSLLMMLMVSLSILNNVSGITVSTPNA